LIFDYILCVNSPSSSYEFTYNLFVISPARYQTEGSRGAIKDRKGNGFPAVKLIGYDKPATLQIFIGSDLGKVSPHMFYQACKVTGKSSTPCIEKKVEGTILIEIEFEPSKEMVIR
jgi:nuclear factor of activated T-cells 5